MAAVPTIGIAAILPFVVIAKTPPTPSNGQKTPDVTQRPCNFAKNGGYLVETRKTAEKRVFRAKNVNIG